jgi:hypothetical protein
MYGPLQIYEIWQVWAKGAKGLFGCSVFYHRFGQTGLTRAPNTYAIVQRGAVRGSVQANLKEIKLSLFKNLKVRFTSGIPNA